MSQSKTAERLAPPAKFKKASLYKAKNTEVLKEFVSLFTEEQKDKVLYFYVDDLLDIRQSTNNSLLVEILKPDQAMFTDFSNHSVSTSNVCKMMQEKDYIVFVSSEKFLSPVLDLLLEIFETNSAITPEKIIFLQDNSNFANVAGNLERGAFYYESKTFYKLLPFEYSLTSED